MIQPTWPVSGRLCGLLLMIAAGLGQAQSAADDQAVMSRMLNAVARCPAVSVSTAPLDWQPTRVGDKGCLARVPPGWRVLNSPTMFSANADASETLGYGWLMGYLPGVHWTPAAMAETVLNELRKQTPSLRAIHATTAPDAYGLGIQVHHLTTRFQRQGLEEVGTIRVLFTGCSPLLGSCSFMTTLFWAPLNQIERHACLLAQINATVQCARGRRNRAGGGRIAGRAGAMPARGRRNLRRSGL